MNDKKMLRTGAVGSAIAAICCFTPALVFLVSAVGLSAIVGWLDYGLFPILFASLGLVALALYRRAGSKGGSPKAIIIAVVITLSVLLIWLEFRYALRISIAALLAVAAYGFVLRRGGNAKEATS
jgi:chromate transport protein ChrA